MLRRFHSILLLIALLIGGAGMNYVQAAKLTGTCGAPGNEANVTWEYNEFGIKPVYIGWVIIRGTGPMMDFADYTQTPWYSKCARIVSVYVTQGVTTIGNNTFGGLYRVENVTIPHGVTSIGQNAFAGCSALTKVSIPHTVTSIGSAAFSSTNLTTLYVAWQNSIPAWVNLSDRTSQVTMHVPCGKTALYQAAAGWNNYNIADGPYYGTCSAGGNTNLPDWTLDCTGTLTIQADDAQMIDWYDLNAIPWYTIRGSIKQVVISGGVKSLGHHAFYDSQNITSVSLNPRLEKIGVLAFGFCRKLTSITIPNAVTSIGGMAFWYNESLTDVYVSWLGDAVPEMPSDIHNYEASRIRLHVPCSEPYIAKGWNTKFTLVVDQPLPSGTCGAQGNNLTWALDCNGTFTVSGSGDMADYSFYTAPWSQYMTSVQSVSISEGVTHIGNYAFYDSSIQSVNLPNSVTSIGNDAFAYCDKLTTVTIPSSVTSIGSLAFYGSDCPLTDIYVNWTTTATIPTWSNTTYTSNQSQVRLHVPCGTTAQYQAAKGWQDFIIVEEPYRGTCGAQGDNLTWSLSCDGTLTISGTGAMRHFWDYAADIPWWNYRGSIQRIVIEEGVTTIGNHAFVQCSNLTSVSLPNTLTAISVLAFGHCTSLPTLVIPSSVTSMAGMFIHNTPSLTDVYVSWTGDAVPDMPADIHPHDASQKRLHIPCGQAGAYYAKGWNTKFTLPDVVSGTCGDNVQWTFESCNGTLTIFGTGPMADYAQLNIVNQNQYIINSTPWRNYAVQTVKIYAGVTTIGAGAFYYVRNTLTSVTMANTITSIGEVAFIQCASLTSIEFSTALNSINTAAFKLCSSLTSISLPNGISTIGKEAFFKCGMTSFTIPISVTSLGKACIANDILTDIYVGWTISDAIPEYNSLTSTNMTATLHVPCGTTSLYQAADGWKDYRITDDIASGICGATGHESDVTWSLSCDGTLTIQGTGAMADWSSSDKVPWYSYRSSITTVNIRDGVTSVGNRAFIDCAVLTSVTIPNSVTSISNNAFFSCSALTGIAIPNSVTTIGQYVFYGCSALTNITIPNSVTSLGESIFRNCSALTDIYVSWASPIPDWPTDFTNKSPQSSITLHVPCGTGDVYAAQDGWKDYTIVANLPRVLSGTCGAVGNVANVTWSLNFCDSTLTISGTGAMRSWTSANNVPWKDYRDNIQHIVIEDGVTSIGQNAFSNCTNVTSLSIGSDVTSIGKTAFYYCTALENIIIPDNVQSIGYMAFGYCSGASTLTIGAGVNSIDQYAFINGSSLTSIVIPDNVQTLGNYAFAGCENVSSVTIGTGVNSIGDYVFAVMPNITDMYVGWTTADAIPAWTTGFTQVSPQSDITLHVPCSAMSLYQAANGWKDYHIEGEGGPYTITVESDDPTMGTVDAVKIGE